MDFTFGKTRRQKCRIEKDSTEKNATICRVKGFTVLRNRFDFNYEQTKARQLAIQFMHAFVKYMQTIEMVKLYPHFNISYHTSHTLQDEIEKFSTFDLKYVACMFISFWAIFCILMWFDVYLFKMLLFTSSRQSLINFFNKLNWFFINNSGLLIFATVVQYFGTIIATLGLMSLFGVAVNQMLYTILFVLMIINCHQSLLLYRNVRNINKPSSKSGLNTALPSTANMRDGKFSSNGETTPNNEEDDDESDEEESDDNGARSHQNKKRKHRRHHKKSHVERASSDEIITLKVTKTDEHEKNEEKKKNKTRNHDSAASTVHTHTNVSNMNSNIVDIKMEYNDKLNEFTQEYKEKLIKAIQQILVPCFCTLMITMFAYLLIGLTTGFDAIRIYSFFLGNFFFISFLKGV
jgi:hypothetical protein